HQALDWGERRVRPYLRSRARWPQHPERGTGGRVRTRHQPRQNLRGKPQGRVATLAGISGKRVLPRSPRFPTRGFFVSGAGFGNFYCDKPILIVKAYIAIVKAYIPVTFLPGDIFRGRVTSGPIRSCRCFLPWIETNSVSRIIRPSRFVQVSTDCAALVFS